MSASDCGQSGGRGACGRALPGCPYPVVALVVLSAFGCEGDIIDTAEQDGAPDDSAVTWVDTGVDTGVDTRGDTRGASVDLTTEPGDPCTLGQCAEGLICMANVCHSICSTGCGDSAPECAPDEACHLVTSFSAACLPGQADYLEPCGDGVRCVGGNLCVKVTGQPSRCLKLCKYGCPPGVPCGTTSNGCEVCIQ